MAASKQETKKEKDTVNPMFTRKRKIGFEPISCDEDRPAVFAEIRSEKVEMFTSAKYPDGIPYVEIIDMETGLENRMWLGGQLNHNLKELAEAAGGNLKGLKVEFNWTGTKQLEIEGEKVKVNQYRLFELN